MYKIILITIILTVLLGCEGQQTFSSYARTGDPVSIAINPSEPDIFLNKENMSVTIKDTDLNVYPILLRHLIRLYSDPTSSYSIRSPLENGWSPSVLYEVAAYTYQGYWVGIVDLIDSGTGLPLVLTAGQGQIIFTSSATGDLSFDIEVLSGIGSSNPLEEALTGLSPLEAFESMPRVEVAVNGLSTSPIGAGVFVFTYNNEDFGGDQTTPQIVHISPDQHIQLISKRTDNLNGTSNLKVMLINPYGFKVDNNV